MLDQDFITYGIASFSPKEITDTGASLESVKLETMVRLQKFRSLLGCSVHLCTNGLTTGRHNSPYHPKGLAVDFYLKIDSNSVKILDLFKASLEAGFKGIGIYYNGKAYSFHFDLRPKYAFWTGTKDGDSAWDYHKLIVDPKDLFNKG